VGATINLGSLGDLEVAPNSLLTLEFDPAGNLVKVNLKRGCTKLRTKPGVNGEVVTPDGVSTKTASTRRANVCFGVVATQAADQGTGLSGGAIAGIVAAVAGAIGLTIYLVTKDDGTPPIVSPSK
jgi:hypothetical protein